jgi:hypothetical protein
MFVGHYGVSFAARKLEPSIPLWILFLAVQLLDVVWAPFVLLGIEKVHVLPGIMASNPFDLYYMPYTHSLVAALLWSAGAFLVYRLLTRRGDMFAALVVGVAVFSHWVLDLVVHRPDLPLFDNTAKVGFGLWNLPVVAFPLEIAVLFGGMWMYFRTGVQRRAATAVFGLIMVVVEAYVFFGPPPASDKALALTSIIAYLVFALVIGLLEAGRGVRSATSKTLRSRAS